MKEYPKHAMEMIEKSELKSLHLTELRYRPPWELLRNNFRKGRLVVAGDAMHATGPFIAQGGSASIEDAIVLARCLSRCAHNNSIINNNNCVGLALDEYVKERRMRIFWLSLQSYLIGKKIDFTSQSRIKNVLVVLFLVVLFRDPDGHTRFDCGTL